MSSKLNRKSQKYKHNANFCDTLVSLSDAAKHLDVSSRTIRRMIDKGELPPIIKIGRLSKISLNAINSYILTLTSKLGALTLW